MNCPECGMPPHCRECRSMEREIVRLQAKIQGLEERLAPESCPDCGSANTTCWECKDAAIEELEGTINDLGHEKTILEKRSLALEIENERLMQRNSNLYSELDTVEREVHEEYRGVIKDGKDLLKELLQLAEERMTGADKWADLDLQTIARRIHWWIEANK